MASDKYYTIKVGFGEPQEVERGELNKKTGQPTGPTQKGIAIVGKITIPNYSKVWGVRKKTPEGKPTGEFTALAWNDPKGEVIEIRLLRSSKSLDKAYQVQAGLKMQDTEAEIELDYGLNYFDPDTEATKVRMLQLHTYNADSLCRDPSNQNIKFCNYDPEKEVTNEIKQDDMLFDAMGFVMKIKDNPRKLKVLAAIFGIDANKPDRIVQAEIMRRLKSNPAKFVEDKDQFFTQAQAILVRAYDFQLIDLSLKGEVRIIGDNSDRPVLDSIGAKFTGVKKLEYMVENLTEPEVFDAFARIRNALIEKEQKLS